MQQFITILLLSIFTTINAAVEYDYIVATDGSGNYTSIQDAIDATKAFPPERKTIFVKKGIYNEKVKVHAWNNDLTIIGEEAAETIITFDDNFKKINRDRNSTFQTWTMLVQGANFIMENITIENSSGTVGQAIALSVESDMATFKNCRIIGCQDALYAAGTNCRQYYKACYIEGTTDYIFGAATALFEDCVIHSKSDSYITAASTPKGVKYGFVFKGCRLTAENGVNAVSLGRPWRDYANVVFINCELGPHIIPAGWNNWNGTERDETAYFAEIANFGYGAKTTKRLKWTHQFAARKAKRYSTEKIFAPKKSEIFTVKSQK